MAKLASRLKSTFCRGCGRACGWGRETLVGRAQRSAGGEEGEAKRREPDQTRWTVKDKTGR